MQRKRGKGTEGKGEWVSGKGRTEKGFREKAKTERGKAFEGNRKTRGKGKHKEEGTSSFFWKRCFPDFGGQSSGFKLSHLARTFF